MTTASDIENDPNFIKCLDHGFVGLVDHMGSDTDIARAARVSYGAGTKSVNEDRGLIRYLVSHKHTSPIEMAEVKLHLKLPIFVMRQLVRHRTSSLNEYSGRYSIMSNEFYVPEFDALKPQSKDNKQGRAGDLPDVTKDQIGILMEGHFHRSYELYETLVADEADGGIGLARELARTVLPVAGYTELYWKQDLHNLLHLIKLRRDNHAQYEIRVFAEAIYQLIKPLFPATIEAWEDYVWEAVTLSRMEVDLLKEILLINRVNENSFEFEDNTGERFGMSKREIKEFRAKWDL